LILIKLTKCEPVAKSFETQQDHKDCDLHVAPTSPKSMAVYEQICLVSWHDKFEPEGLLSLNGIDMRSVRQHNYSLSFPAPLKLPLH